MKILQQHFSIIIFYFLYYFSFLHFTLSHTFHSFFLFFFSCFSPPHTCPPLSLPPSFIFLFSLILPHSERSRELHSLFLSPVHSLSLSLLLDPKTLSVIRKFSFSPSFKNIPGSSHLCAVAHLRPHPSPDELDGFCPLSFFCYDLINFKIVFLSLYSDNLIMLEFRDV